MAMLRDGVPQEIHPLAYRPSATWGMADKRRRASALAGGIVLALLAG